MILRFKERRQSRVNTKSVIKGEKMDLSNFENPFDSQCEVFSKCFDDAMNNKCWNRVLELISAAEKYVENSGNVFQAPIFYSLGTAYADLSMTCESFKNDITIEKALFTVFEEGKILTSDLGGKNTTNEFTNEIINKIKTL